MQLHDAHLQFKAASSPEASTITIHAIAWPDCLWASFSQVNNMAGLLQLLSHCQKPLGYKKCELVPVHTAVEPLNKGHLGPCREALLFSETEKNKFFAEKFFIRGEVPL